MKHMFLTAAASFIALAAQANAQSLPSDPWAAANTAQQPVYYQQPQQPVYYQQQQPVYYQQQQPIQVPLFAALSLISRRTRAVQITSGIRKCLNLRVK